VRHRRGGRHGRLTGSAEAAQVTDRCFTSSVALRAMPTVGGPVLVDYLDGTVRGIVREIAAAR
jgi:hypothetical protein